MLSARAAALCVALFGCHNDPDPGFEIVRVPLSAYAPPDAAARVDAKAAPATVSAKPDEGEGPIIVCVSPPSSGDDDDPSNDSDCPDTYRGRSYDERATARHRNSEGDGICCYRRGRRGRSDSEERE